MLFPKLDDPKATTKIREILDCWQPMNEKSDATAVGFKVSSFEGEAPRSLLFPRTLSE